MMGKWWDDTAIGLQNFIDFRNRIFPNELLLELLFW